MQQQQKFLSLQQQRRASLRAVKTTAAFLNHKTIANNYICKGVLSLRAADTAAAEIFKFAAAAAAAIHAE